jgi:hypothetical protein
MDLETYGIFLIGSILVSLGIVVLGIGLLFLNHIYSKFWITVKLFSIYSYDLPTKESQPVANTSVEHEQSK